jgi:hypothetical protein
MSEIIAIQDDSMSNIAGALVWWELRGNLPLEELAEAVALQGLPAAWLPTAARMETVARRAGQACIEHNRQLLRPLGKRGHFDFVTESIESESEKAGSTAKLHYQANVRVLVDDQSIHVEPATSSDVALAKRIASAVEAYTDLLVPGDVSTWLIWVLEHRVFGVSLRQRGGFYFVPAGEPLETWRKVARCIASCSEHVCSSMSAVRSDDAVAAILKAVRDEADEKLKELEAYMDGPVSTRGINAWTRSIATLQRKLERYSDLLGVELTETSSRATTLLGCLCAAKLVEVDA